ncbi:MULTISPECIES: hypothetical protein [Arthrobacter]|uniref:hypothetical protein n=1 Tax=Arthrobacter TaxID=1663 RepID=UPI0033912985
MVEAVVNNSVNNFCERSLLGAVPALAQAADAKLTVCNAVAGFGALQLLLEDPDEVMHIV